MAGQVGVGTTTPSNSAQLDVTATNKGMLIPRIALINSSDTTTITNGNVESLIVYNTATKEDVVPGFYYWNGSVWQKIISDGDTTFIDSNTGLSTGAGSPAETNPINPEAGDIYIDETNGDVYTFNGDIWKPQTGISADPDNALINGSDGLAYLDKSLLESISAISSGDGSPTLTNPVNPNSGDIYVDNNTGIIYTYNGATWEKQNVVSSDTNNTITVGSDGLAYLDQTTIPTNETITTFTQDDATGITTYVSENGTITTADITSKNLGNILLTGTDGGSYLDQSAIQSNETITTFTQDDATGITTYTSESGTITTADITSKSIGNILSTGTDGGSYIDQLAIQLNESVTTFSQDNTTGIATYISENGTITAADITSNDSGNLLINGTDGGSYLGKNAIKNNETLTSYVQNTTTGVVSYTSEDNSVTTSNTTSGNAGNLLITGTDGGAFINKAVIKANETITSLVQNDNTGIITYTSENGTVVNTDVTSANIGNLITSGTDGGSFMNQATIKSNETVTTFVQNNSNGISTYVSENGTLSTANTTSSDPGNILTTGTDGGSFIKQADIKANETATTSVQNNSTGVITYTSENGVVYNSDVTSTQSGNLLTTGSDGGSYIDKQALQKPWFGTDDNTSATLNTENMYAMGNIGIGTNNPISPLHVVTTGINYSGVFDSQPGSGEATIARFRNMSPVAIGNKAYIGFYNGFGGAAWGIGSRRIGVGGPADEEFVINNSLGGLYIERIRIKSNGYVGINIANPTEVLHVNGNILASGTITPDYVFEKYFDGVSKLNPKYNMLGLEDVEDFVKQHKHLPGVPSANDIKEKGGVLVNRAIEINLEKVEELFLYIIEQQKLLKQQQSLLRAKGVEIDDLKTRMDKLEVFFELNQK